MSSFETKVITSSFVSLPKLNVIEMRDNFEEPVIVGWKDLLISTGLGYIGMKLPVAGQYIFGATAIAGALSLLPSTKERIADELSDISDSMNNNDNVIIEFEEELVYETVTDLVNNIISERRILSIKDWANTGTTYIPVSSIGDFLGI